MTNLPVLWGSCAASDTRPGGEALCGNRITGVIRPARDIYSPAGDPARSGVTKSSSEAARRDGRSIPSLFIRCISVVRFKPSFIAAPFGPPIFQPLASSAWSMSARSESRSVIGAARFWVCGLPDPSEWLKARGLRHSGLAEWVWKHAILCQNYRTLHQVLKFSYVARPRVRREGCYSLRRNVVDVPPRAPAEDLDEVFQ